MRSRKADEIAMLTQFRARTLLILVLALFPGGPAAAEEDAQAQEEPRRFFASAGVGFDYSTGDYGESVTTDVYSPSLSLKLEYEPALPWQLELPLTLRVLVPYVVIDGPDDVLPGEGATNPFDEPASRRHGIGDIITSLTYTYYPRQKFVPIVDVITKFKIPSASTSRSIGTGHLDVTFGLEIFEQFGPVGVFGGGSYRIKGGGDYHDIWLASVGAQVSLGRSVALGAAYDYRQASTDGVGDSHELAPYASLRLTDHLRFSPYGVIGLSTNAPAWGLGGTFIVNF